MTAATISAIVSLVLGLVEASLAAGKSINIALAESLEEAAASLRAGRLSVDRAVDRARTDQGRIDALLGRRG